MKIVVFHIARSSSTVAPGIFVPVSRANVMLSKKLFGQARDATTMPIIASANISKPTVEGNFIHLGTAARAAVPPLETKLKPTPFKDALPEYPCRVAVSEKDVPRTLATESKYGNPRKRISHRQIEYGVRVACRMLCGLSKRQRSYMNIDEILDVDLNTATGFGWTGKRRRDLIRVEADGTRKMEAALEKAYRSLESDYTDGDYPPAVYIPCAKDEILPKDKIAAGKVRTFQYDSLEHYLLGRKYIGNFCEHITDLHLKGPIRIGLNIHCRDFHDIMEQTFAAISRDEVIDIDYSGYDRSLMAYLAKAAAQVLDCWYGNQDPGRTQWILSNFFAVEIFGSAIWQRLQGLPSGMFGTAVINSVINIILIAAAFKNLLPQATVEDFINNIKMSIYGDDNLIGPSPAAKAAGFNFVYLQEYFATVGIVITPADKDNASALFVQRTQTQFLKKRILWSEEFQGYVPIIPSHYVWDHLSYARDTSFSGLVQLCDSLLGEYFFRGRIRESVEIPTWEPTFDELRAKMCKILGSNCLVTYESLNEKYWDMSALPQAPPAPYVEPVEDEWEMVMEPNMSEPASPSFLREFATVVFTATASTLLAGAVVAVPILVMTHGWPGTYRLIMSRFTATEEAHFQNEQRESSTTLDPLENYPPVELQDDEHHTLLHELLIEEGDDPSMVCCMSARLDLEDESFDCEDEVIMSADMGNVQTTSITNNGTGSVDVSNHAEASASASVAASKMGSADATNTAPITGTMPGPKIQDGFKPAAHTQAKKAMKPKRSQSLTRDRPTNWVPSVPVVKAALYLPSLNGIQHGVWLADLVGCDTAATAEDMNCSDDCTSLDYFTRRWGLDSIYNIAYSLTKGSLVIAGPMSPFRMLFPLNYTLPLNITPLEFAASLYKFWRGGLEVKFNIFGPAAVSGRLAICLGYNDFGADPGYQKAVTGPSVMWDFDSMNREKVVRIDYINPNAWLQAPYNVDPVNAPNAVNVNINSSLGTFRVYLVTALTSPNATFNRGLDIVVTVRASPTFETKFFAPLALSPTQCVTPSVTREVPMDANMDAGSTVSDTEPMHNAASQGVKPTTAPAVPIELKQFALKYANLDTFTVGLSSAPGALVTYNHPADTIIAQAKYAQAAMKFYRGDCHVKAFPRGNGWQGGAIYMTFVPYAQSTPTTVHQALSLPGVFLDLSSSEPVELIIPFSYFQSYFYDGCPSAGMIVFWLLSTIQVPTVGGRSVDFEIQVAWSNFESFVPNEIGDAVLLMDHNMSGMGAAEETTAQTELALQKAGPPPDEPILSRHKILRSDTPQNIGEALKRSYLLMSDDIAVTANVPTIVTLDLADSIGGDCGLFAWFSRMFQVEKGDLAFEITIRGAVSAAVPPVDVSKEVSAFLVASDCPAPNFAAFYAAMFREDLGTAPGFVSAAAGHVGYNPPGTALLVPGHTRAIVPFMSATNVNATVFSELVGPHIGVGQLAYIILSSPVKCNVSLEVRYAPGDSHRFGAFRGIPPVYAMSVKNGTTYFVSPDVGY